MNTKLSILLTFKEIIDSLGDSNIEYSNKFFFRYTLNSYGRRMTHTPVTLIYPNKNSDNFFMQYIDNNLKEIRTYKSIGVNSRTPTELSTTKVSDILCLKETYEEMGENGLILTYGRDFFQTPSVKGPFGVELVTEDSLYEFLIEVLNHIKGK